MQNVVVGQLTFLNVFDVLATGFGDGKTVHVSDGLAMSRAKFIGRPVAHEAATTEMTNKQVIRSAEIARAVGRHLSGQLRKERL
jgi:hypothetical protein